MAAIEFNPQPWMKLGVNTTATFGLGTKHEQSMIGFSTDVHMAFGRFEAAN